MFFIKIQEFTIFVDLLMRCYWQTRYIIILSDIYELRNYIPTWFIYREERENFDLIFSIQPFTIQLRYARLRLKWFENLIYDVVEDNVAGKHSDAFYAATKVWRRANRATEGLL